MPPDQKQLPAFCFLDEAGAIGNPASPYFAVGAILHPWPDDLIEELHFAFESLVSACKKERTAQEFHFADLTKGTLIHFDKAISCLEKDPSWRFFSVVIDLRDPGFIQPRDALGKWACYLRWTKLMLQRNLRAHEKTTLLADFLRKPRGAGYKLATLPAVVPQLWDVLQVESQGVLMVQMADVLLGASLYEGKSECKIMLAKRVRELRQAVGNLRFNEWRVRWDKK